MREINMYSMVEIYEIYRGLMWCLPAHIYTCLMHSHRKALTLFFSIPDYKNKNQTQFGGTWFCGLVSLKWRRLKWSLVVFLLHLLKCIMKKTKLVSRGLPLLASHSVLARQSVHLDGRVSSSSSPLWALTKPGIRRWNRARGGQPPQPLSCYVWSIQEKLPEGMAHNCKPDRVVGNKAQR